MRILTAAIVFAPLMLIGALPVAAAPPTVTLGYGAPVRLAANDVSAADRDTYTQKAQDDMQEWQRKLHEYSAKAETKGSEVGKAAAQELNTAWAKAEAASRQLQIVSADGWDSARSSFEGASRELTEAWHKVQPDDK